MSSQVLDLDELQCQRVSVAGGKAAGLSRARSAGLPVLNGAVVTTTAATPSLRAGAEALAQRGSGGARRATLAEVVDEDLAAVLRDKVTELGGDVIVRSSAGVEGAGEWAGAFSTFSEVTCDDIVTAVRGCWSSAFSVDVVERCERVGLEPGDLTMAVLIQPRISPSVAGLARFSDEVVEIEAVEGSPAALMAGWAAGQRSIVRDGRVSGPDGSILDEAEARAVAELAQMTFERVGHSVVEWAIADGRLLLLQSVASAAPAEQSAPTYALGELDDPEAERIARLAIEFPGGVCDELVFPWALGLGSGLWRPVIPPGTSEQLDRVAAVQTAAIASRSVWAGQSDDAIAACRELLRELRGPAPGAALSRLRDLRPPDSALGREVLDLVLRAGQAAVDAGFLRDASDAFECELAELAAQRPPRQSWAGARRWEPFLAGVAQARGTAYRAAPASPGVGAGRALLVRDAHDPPLERRPRQIIVAPLPVPALSALLWDAAGLVTTGGSAGAHLIEVARSLGVPAVVGCDRLPEATPSDEVLLAVDGDAGTVARLLLQGEPLDSRQGGSDGTGPGRLDRPRLVG